MFNRVNAWDSVPPINAVVCKTPNDVRVLAKRMARRPIMPVVRLKKPEPIPEITKPEPKIDTAPLCRRILLLMWRGPDATSRITTSKVIGTVAFRYGFTRAEILSHSKPVPLSRARHIAMYLARELTNNSYIQLGVQFGNRDHTTAVHGVQKIKRELQYDTELADEIDDLRRGLMA